MEVCAVASLKDKYPGEDWKSDTNDAVNTRIDLIAAMSVPADGPGTKMRKMIDEWIKKGNCLRYKNVGIDSLADAKSYVTHAFSVKVKRVLSNTEKLIRKEIAKEAGRDGKMKKKDNTDKAKELTREEQLKIEERLAKLQLVKKFFDLNSESYGKRLKDRILSVKLPAYSDEHATEDGSISASMLEQIRAACTPHQAKVFDESVMQNKIDALFHMGKTKEITALTPFEVKAAAAAPSLVEAGDSSINALFGDAEAPFQQRRTAI